VVKSREFKEKGGCSPEMGSPDGVLDGAAGIDSQVGRRVAATARLASKNGLEPEAPNCTILPVSGLISVLVSVLALVISGVTAWLTLFRRGTIRMTQPTVVFFGPDSLDQPDLSKVFLRALLYSTAKRGQIVESMFVKLRRGESLQTFNIWVYGEDSLSRGSGLYVGENGVACNHHFLLPEDGTRFDFLPGEYKVEVYASRTGSARPVLLRSIGGLVLSDQTARQLRDKESGVYFDWGPDSQRYHAHVRKPRREPPSDFLRDLVRNPASRSGDTDPES